MSIIKYFTIQGKYKDAESVLEKIYAPEELENEVQELMLSINKEIETEASLRSIGMFDLLKKREIRAALVVGVGLQVYYITNTFIVQYLQVQI